MRRRRWILLSLTLLLLVILASWLWWISPRRVDMATYAPADTLLYLEANRPLAVLETIVDTSAWKAFEKTLGTPAGLPKGRWLQRFVEHTGIGSIQSVILTRAQVAAVVMDVGTVEEGDTLRVRPEVAILIETHTAERRIRPTFEEALKALAEKTYGSPVERRVIVDGVEIVEWTAREGSRQIVGTLIGSLAIVGNTEHAVQNCAAVSLRRRPSLKTDAELDQMRLRVGGENVLTFGYVSSKNSARLLATGLPLILGRTSGDAELQRLITNGAAKIFGSLGWASKAYQTGIEDRYLITLQPSIAARLKPSFDVSHTNAQVLQLLTEDVHSATSYKFTNPVASWQSLKRVVSSQSDTLSTVVFSYLLKSSLSSYGINDPDAFLRCLSGEVVTLRFDENGERSILIGHVQDEIILRSFLKEKMRLSVQDDRGGDVAILEDSRHEFAASLARDLIVVGPSADVRRYATSRQSNAELNAEKLKRITFFVPSQTVANVITFTDDRNRVRSFIAALLAAKILPAASAEHVEQVVSGLPFSVTESVLGEYGIERVTRSPLGQFSTMLPLVVPQQYGLNTSERKLE